MAELMEIDTNNKETEQLAEEVFAQSWKWVDVVTHPFGPRFRSILLHDTGFIDHPARLIFIPFLTLRQGLSDAPENP